MADLKTAEEERATVRSAVGAWQHDDALAAMAALDDLDTLLAENVKLRAVTERSRALVAAGRHTAAEELTYTALDAALAALEAP